MDDGEPDGEHGQIDNSIAGMLPSVIGVIGSFTDNISDVQNQLTSAMCVMLCAIPNPL